MHVTSQGLPTEGNFAALLWWAAQQWPDHPAIEEAGVPTTYQQLVGRAGAARDLLVAHGVVPGDRVAVLLPRGADATAAIFGTLASGAIVSVLNEELRPAQIAHVCRTLGARALLADVTQLTPERRAVLGETIAIDLAADGPPATAPRVPAARAPRDAAQITFTSGSTGAPKGVVASQSNLWAGVTCVREYLGLRSDDRIASLLSFAFVYGFNQLTTALSVGATLIVERSVLPPVLVGALAQRRVTVMAAVPPLWQQILGVASFRDAPWPALRLATNAGGHLAPTFVRAIRAAQPQASLYLMYGLTEVFRSTFLPPDEVDAHPDSMGRAVPGSRVCLVREDGTECAVDEVGELIHSGPTVALRYWNDPAATALVFRPDPLAPAGTSPVTVVHSGDLARRDAEGRLFHCGRRDGVIKSLGFRISPDEISDVIFASGQVSECAVHGIPDPARGQAIVAHVVLRPGSSLERVRIAVGRELPRHMHPTRLVEHAALPRTPNGKIDLPALRAALR